MLNIICLLILFSISAAGITIMITALMFDLKNNTWCATWQLLTLGFSLSIGLYIYTFILLIRAII